MTQLKVMSKIKKFTDVQWTDFLSQKTEEERRRINFLKTVLDECGPHSPHWPILVKLFIMVFLKDSREGSAQPKIISSIKRLFDSKKIKELFLEVSMILLKIWQRSRGIDYSE